jgi:hypothetical protein
MSTRITLSSRLRFGRSRRIRVARSYRAHFLFLVLRVSLTRTRDRSNFLTILGQPKNIGTLPGTAAGSQERPALNPKEQAEIGNQFTQTLQIFVLLHESPYPVVSFQRAALDPRPGRSPVAPTSAVGSARAELSESFSDLLGPNWHRIPTASVPQERRTSFRHGSPFASEVAEGFPVRSVG